MPFQRMDPAAFEEWAEELGPELLPPNRPSGEYEYEPATASFDPAKLSPVSAVLLESLRSASVTHLRVRYDGGYDEGFGHPEALRLSGTDLPMAEILPTLATPERVERIRKAASQDSMWGNAEAFYAEATPVNVVRYGLDELAQELAALLLGSGFGTGEYSLYGALTADLVTGKIEDDPNATRPDSAG